MRYVVLILVLSLSGGMSVVSADVASIDEARALVHRLRSASLMSFAAADPDQYGRFVAALYVPEQLLVVEAIHPDVAAVENRIAAGEYRDVYLDLQGTPSPQGRLFVVDAHADGLLASPPDDAGVDIVYNGTDSPLLLNGDLGERQRTSEAYEQAVAAADARYTRALRVLGHAFDLRGTQP